MVIITGKQQCQLFKPVKILISIKSSALRQLTIVFANHWSRLNVLSQIEHKKLRKYDLIANELALIYKSKEKMITYVMTSVGLIKEYHKKYRKKIGISLKTEAYIQSIVLKKTLEGISFGRRGSIEEDNIHRGEIYYYSRMIGNYLNKT